MHSTDFIVKIVPPIIAIISAWVSYYLIPLVKQSSYWKQFGIMNDFVTDCVRAANQLYSPEEYQTKKKYVTALVTDFVNSFGMNFTAEQIDAIIEGIVNEVKAGTNND